MYLHQMPSLKASAGAKSQKSSDWKQPTSHPSLWSGRPSTDKYTVSGNKQTKAGNYQIRIALKDNVNYKWHDGTTADLFINWTINKAKIDLPVFESLHIYTGKKISVDIEENELWSIFYNPEKEVGKQVR